MSLKKIGIPGWNVGDNTFGVSKSYLAYIAKFGIPVILTPQHDVEELDLLVLSGGKDVLPSNYGAKPGYFTQDPNVMLECFDKDMLPKYIENNIPILGICRGAQSLWGRFGGEMDQHNNWHEQSKFNEDTCHHLLYTQQYAKYDKLLNHVNSRHHQTMSTKRGDTTFIPEELDVIAYARESKTSNNYYPTIVEIFKHKERPIFACQFHPEDLSNDKLIPKIIEEFLSR